MNKLPLIQIKKPPSLLPSRHSSSESEDNKITQLNNFDIAIDFYTKGIDNNKNNTSFLIKRATCYLAKGYYTLALSDSLKTIEIDPEFDKGYYIAALAYLEMYDIEKAEELSMGKNQRLSVLIDKTKKDLKNKCQKYKSYPKYINFLRELYKYDSFFPKLEIKFFSDSNRGVVAKSFIKKMEIIMIIPKPCLISLEVALNTEIGKEISKFMYKELSSPKHCLFSSFLLSEEKSEKWKFYFDFLPVDFSYFPIFYTNKELNCLTGSPFLTQIIEKKIEIQSDYEKICSFIPSFKQYSFLKFCQARMAVGSRVFGISMNNERTDVLAPFADLINHKSPSQTQWYYDNSLDAFVIQALEDIPEGNEIYDSYGKKTNSQLLLHYGFCLEDNDRNEYYLTLNFNKNVPLYEQKKIFFSSPNDCLRTFKLYTNMYESELDELLSFLRFLIFDGDFSVLYKKIKSNKVNINTITPVSFYYIEPTSKDLEIKVLKHLNWILREALRRYPTSLEEDKLLLKTKKNIPFNMKNCLYIIKSEKEILIYYIYFCEYCLSLFKLSELEIITKISNDFKFTECQFSLYIQEVILKLIHM